MTALRIGSLNYINILPVMFQFPAIFGAQYTGLWQTVLGSPEQLNGLLADGLLEVSPISSIEYARHQEEYVLLPDLAIASSGHVKSVVLFSRVPLPDLGQRTVGICRATATSRVLLRILLEDYVGVRPQYAEDATAQEALSGAYDAALLIGDAALAFRLQLRQLRSSFQEHDLGHLWWQACGLPMVFAVWAARKRGVDALHTVTGSLLQSRDLGVQMPPTLLDSARLQTGMSIEELEQYFRCIEYHLGAKAQEGLLQFYRLAAKKALSPACSTLQFFAASGQEKLSCSGPGGYHV